MKNMRLMIFVLICYISVVIKADDLEACDGERCANGECIDELNWCDGSPQCSDKSDETNCISMLCGDADFKCRYGACIPIDNKCDQKIDCWDGSDEWACVTHCRANDFQCGYGGCIDLDKKCNGNYDCPDQTDEFPPLCDEQ